MHITEHSDFVIEDMGMQELWVYDIEVEENHNFFANDILVHNSAYLTLNSLIKKLGKDHITGDDRVNMLDKLGKILENKVINPACDELTVLLNNVEKKLFMDREAIATTGIFVKKKRYALSVMDMEDVRYTEPHLKIQGIETNRSSTPPLAQTALKESLRIMLTQSESDLQQYVFKMKKQWMTEDYKNISYVSSVNNLAKYTGGDGLPEKGCPGHVKAAINTNIIYNNLGLDVIQEGEKAAFLTLKQPNPWDLDVFAYSSGTSIAAAIYTAGLENYIDREQLWKEKFMNPLTAICEVIGWNPVKIANLRKFFG